MTITLFFDNIINSNINNRYIFIEGINVIPIIYINDNIVIINILLVIFNLTLVFIYKILYINKNIEHITVTLNKSITLPNIIINNGIKLSLFFQFFI